MNNTDKKKIVRSSITQAGVPVLFDEVISGEAKIQESKSVEYIENGDYSVVPDTGFDAVAQVNVTVDVPTGPVAPVNPGHVDTLAELADYAKACDVYGAVLSKETEGDNTGKYIIWNDVEGSQTWDPSAIEETPVVPSGHGDNVAVCIGDGIWLMTGWVGLIDDLIFAADTTQLYNDFISVCVKGSGKDNSDYILTHYASEINSTDTPLWDALKTLKETYAGAYIPNTQELINIFFKLATVPSESGPFEYNTNIAHVFGVSTIYTYWSSSQFVNYVYFVYFFNAADGNISNHGKDNSRFSFAVLSFDTPAEVQDQGIGVE